MDEYQYHIFSPYRVCPLGAHVDHQHGLVIGFAIDKGVDLWFTVNGSSQCETFSQLNNKSNNGSKSPLILILSDIVHRTMAFLHT